MFLQDHTLIHERCILLVPSIQMFSKGRAMCWFCKPMAAGSKHIAWFLSLVDFFFLLIVGWAIHLKKKPSLFIIVCNFPCMLLIVHSENWPNAPRCDVASFSYLLLLLYRLANTTRKWTISGSLCIRHYI